MLARAQHGALPDQAAVSLGDLAAAALAVRAGAIAARSLTVQRPTSARRIGATGSQALVGRMVDNVIDNAIVHNADGGWIRVEAGLLRQAGGRAPVSWRTAARSWTQAAGGRAGPAVPSSASAPTGPAPAAGSGLGLSIVAAIAAAHGGTLDLLARPDGGLRVVITLPLAPAAAMAGARA